MAPTFADVQAAADRLSGLAVRTPLLESPLLNRRLGCRVLIKAECLQLTGSFKFRGAYNRISRLTPEEIARGVVAYSTGNHAQGIAAAANYMGARAVIVVPTDTPAIKQANTRAWGAELIFYDRETEDREAVAAGIAQETGGTIVPPFDDPRVIAGQGTIGIEIADQARAAGVELDALLIPCGGGGLTAGIALALEALSPATRIFTVEPEAYDDTRRSLAAGKRLANDRSPGHPTSFCDALTAPMPGEITFPINRDRVAAALAIPDTAVTRGIYAAFADFKLVLEPSGAIALAALVTGALDGTFDTAGKAIGVVCSGGNVDPARYAEALTAGPPVPPQ